MECQSYREGCCGCCVNMRWSRKRIEGYLTANTRAAARYFGDSRFDFFTMVRMHLNRGGWLDHLLCFWLALLTCGVSAWLWKRYFGSCCFAGFLNKSDQRVGCLIHPARLAGKDLRQHAFPLLLVVRCYRELRCPMLDYQEQDLTADWFCTSKAGSQSLNKH